MSYSPNNWQNGDTITAEKLNHLESGVEAANDPFIIPLTQTDTAYTTTVLCSEIAAALTAGKDIMFVIREETGGIITNALTMGGISYDPNNTSGDGYILGQVVRMKNNDLRMVFIAGSNMDAPPSFFYLG